MKTIIITITATLLLVFIVAISFRVRKDIKKKLQFENTYAIQNIATGNALRPLNANYESGIPIIAYPIKNWECITWEMIEIDTNTYLLKDLFTEKTFQPESEPKPGVGLWQQSMGGTQMQHWEFLKQAEEKYLIRLKGTELYISTSSNETDSPIILLPKKDSKTQLWKLLPQTPWI